MVLFMSEGRIQTPDSRRRLHALPPLDGTITHRARGLTRHRDTARTSPASRPRVVHDKRATRHPEPRRRRRSQTTQHLRISNYYSVVLSNRARNFSPEKPATRHPCGFYARIFPVIPSRRSVSVGRSRDPLIKSDSPLFSRRGFFDFARNGRSRVDGDVDRRPVDPHQLPVKWRISLYGGIPRPSCADAPAARDDR